MAVAFAGGSPMRLLTTSPKGNRVARRVGDGGPGRGRPSRLDRYLPRRGRGRRAQPPRRRRGGRELVEAITATKDFAEQQKVEYWPQVFADALRQWTDAGLTPDYHPDLYPPGRFDDATVRLAAMAQMANVFGAMGSGTTCPSRTPTPRSPTSPCRTACSTP